MSLPGRISLVALLLLIASTAGADPMTSSLRIAGVATDNEVLSWNSSGQNAITVAMYMGSLSNALMNMAWSDKRLDEATLIAGDYLRVVMKNATVVNFSIEGGPGEIPRAFATLQADSVQYDYTRRNAKVSGDALGVSVPAPPPTERIACTAKLPGEDDLLQVHSWRLNVEDHKPAPFTFTTRTGEIVTNAVDAYRNGKAGSVMIRCGARSALTLSGAKIASVASEAETGMTTVSLTYEGIEPAR